MFKSSIIILCFKKHYHVLPCLLFKEYYFAAVRRFSLYVGMINFIYVNQQMLDYIKIICLYISFEMG